MAYGAKESNTDEGTGLTLFVAGLVAFAASWAYAGGIVQIIVGVLGIVGFVAGLVMLRSAKAKG